LLFFASNGCDDGRFFATNQEKHAIIVASWGDLGGNIADLFVLLAQIDYLCGRKDDY
jgi:hypothetical protein